MFDKLKTMSRLARALARKTVLTLRNLEGVLRDGRCLDDGRPLVRQCVSFNLLLGTHIRIVLYEIVE